jgi:hypothetical protein
MGEQEPITRIWGRTYLAHSSGDAINALRAAVGDDDNVQNLSHFQDWRLLLE